MTEDHRLIKSAKSARDCNVSEASIPDDVIILANRACHDCYDHKTSTWFDVRDIIARAILAENERCAKIAQQWAKDRPYGIDQASNWIASAIRRR